MHTRDNATQLKEKTASSFGFEWTRFGDVFAEYEANFLGYIDPVSKEFLKGKLVLDAGCGAGRHAYFASKYGAKVVAFDISNKAVRSTRRNTSGMPDARVVQADIYDLPDDWEGKFDCVLGIGILHHLPDPQEGFNKLVPLLRSGGTISIWVYGRRDNRLAICLYEPLRRITTRIPHKVLYWLAYPLAVLMEIVNRLRLPIFRHYRRFLFKTKWNDVFDVFSAPSARYYDLEDIRGWFEQAGLKNARVSYRMLEGKAKGIKGMGVKRS